MGTILPTLLFISHKTLTATGAGMLHLSIALEQIPMRIPPDHPAMIRAKAALPMPWT
jgi:hypothetical protein